MFGLYHPSQLTCQSRSSNLVTYSHVEIPLHVGSIKSGHVHGGKNPYKMEEPEYYSFLHAPIKNDAEEIPLDENIARAIDFLGDRKVEDKPFMLFLPTAMPHPVYNTLEEFHNMYDADELLKDIISVGEATGKPSFVELIKKYRKLGKLDEKVLAKIYAVYLGMNSYVDLMLGKLMDKLESTGLSKNTTIIVCSDHGDWAGNHGLVEKWPNAMDDDMVRVPLIIKAPGYKAGHVVKEQVEMFDIMATVLDIAGIKATHTHFAQSLVPQLEGALGDPERAVFCEGGYDRHEPHCFEGYKGRVNILGNPENIYYPKLLQQQECPESVCRTTMIRTLSHKLIKRSTGENELYDLVNDAKELKNIYFDNAYLEKRQELEGRMLDWYLHTADVVPQNDDPRKFI